MQRKNHVLTTVNLLGLTDANGKVLKQK